MSYVTQAQKDWIQMLYGESENHDDYQTLLDTFGRLVEEKVLTAEQNTDLQRSKNTFKEVKERLQGRGKDLMSSLREIAKQAGSDALNANEVHGLFMKTLAEVGQDIRKDEKIPDEVYRQITEFGLTCVPFSEELGGVGFPYPVFIACLETLGKASPSVGVRFAISNTTAEGLRFNFADLSDYGKKILGDLVSGEKLAAFCLTEGSVSGSNIMQEMETRADLSEDGTHYRINGNKFWITNAEVADVYGVFARTSNDPAHGVSLFLVERDAPGFSIGQVFEKRIVENSSLGELIFKNVEIPVDHRVGKEGHGAQYAVRMLNSGRTTIAALATGLAQRAFEEYLEIAVEGKKFAGKNLFELDRTKARIAEMSTEINAARDLTYRAAWLKGRYDADPGNREFLREYVIEANAAKLKASLVAQKVCDTLVKIGGASSIVKETFSLKHYLDSFLYYFGEAVPEVLENVISHMEVKKYQTRKGL